MPHAASNKEMRVLVTGAAGFVAPYVIDALKRFASIPTVFFATAKAPGSVPGIGEVAALDITDRDAVSRLVAGTRPHVIVHLAGVSDLGIAHANPQAAWNVNLGGTLNVARATLQHSPDAVFLFAGSCQVYGTAALSGQLLDECALLEPTGEYAATKAAADLALGMLARRGLRSLRMRPFNHIGPGQTPSFSVPSFAAQIARIEKGMQEPVIKVGNLEPQRDFLDVRDVADAYAKACLKADSLEPGSIFNIASGTPIRLREILDKMIALAGCQIRVEVDPARWRENEIPLLAGDARKAAACLDWSPGYSIDETLNAVLSEQRAKCRSAN
ncbi:MAG: NAD-dependent [Beijerinckiaceae bacterium]|nr:MAG: NAD-dependent [Beijerinckiaceae bacterium]